MGFPDRNGWLRIAALVAPVALYGLGWWAGHRGAHDAQIVQDARNVLAIGPAWRARQDSLGRVASAERAAAYAAGARRAREDSARQADSARSASRVARAISGPLDSALAGIPLTRQDANVFTTDSAGARMIAREYAEAAGLRLTIGHDAAELADARLEANHWRLADLADGARADSAEGRVAILETHLDAVLKVKRGPWLSIDVGPGVGCGVAARGGFDCIAGPTVSVHIRL